MALAVGFVNVGAGNTIIDRMCRTLVVEQIAIDLALGLWVKVACSSGQPVQCADVLPMLLLTSMELLAWSSTTHATPTSSDKCCIATEVSSLAAADISMACSSRWA